MIVRLTVDNDLSKGAVTFKMLADPVRLALMCALEKGEKSVTDLCQLLKVAQPTCSHHLGILRMAGMVKTRRAGKSVIYSSDARSIKFTF